MANYYQQQSYVNCNTQYSGYETNQQSQYQDQYGQQQNYQQQNYQQPQTLQTYGEQYGTPQQHDYNSAAYTAAGYDQSQGYYNQTPDQSQGQGYNYDTQYGSGSYAYYNAPPLPSEPHPSTCAQPPDSKRKITEAQVKEARAAAKNAPRVYPVSCGTDHKKDSEGYVPKRPPIPTEVMSQIALAKSKLEINPHDQASLSQLNSAMMAYNNFEQDRHQSVLDQMNEQFNRHGSNYAGPGMFTGQPLVEPMDKDEIDCHDYRTFARPDMFYNLKPLRENYGKFIMRKMGWREGRPLGTSGNGSLAPIELTVKIDRKGLMNDLECVRKKPEGIAKNEGPTWICKIVNAKSPISGLSEVHQAMGVPSPIYEVVSENDGTYKWKVKTTWGSFTPFRLTKNKKMAKAECAYNALKEILRIESERLGVEPPAETTESCFLRAIFVPSNKSVSGQKMLYKHFYKGGNLMNVMQEQEYYSNIELKTRNETDETLPKDTRNMNVIIAAATVRSNVPKPNANETIKGPLLTGANWMIKIVNGKNSSSALIELCQSVNKPRPNEYSQCVNKVHLVSVDTPWGSFTPTEGDTNRKNARRKACYHAIKEVMKQEAAKFNSKPPLENSDSTDSNLSFSVATL